MDKKTCSRCQLIQAAKKAIHISTIQSHLKEDLIVAFTTNKLTFYEFCQKLALTKEQIKYLLDREHWNRRLEES